MTPLTQYEEVKRFIEEDTVPHQLEELLALVAQQLEERRKEWMDGGAHA
jgi:hypothetical protein